jgi:ribosomal protein L21E
MKKWIIGVSIIVILAVAYLYLFIPTMVSFHNSLTFGANFQGFNRVIYDQENWEKWWPGKEQNPASKNIQPAFQFKGNTYTVVEKRYNSFVISITGDDIKANTSLNFVPVTNDSVHLIWIGQSITSSNPFKRLQLYQELKELNSNMEGILETMRSYFSKQENIYGRSIQQIPVTDSVLVSTYGNSKGYPTTEFIYGLIDELEIYASSQSTKETGFPMLHVTTTDSVNFLTRVALPVEKRLPSSGNISYKWMMAGGKILVTEVKGGPAIIQKAFRELENYVHDHRRVAPAIPFQSLITDRMKEKDTSKWVTKIYYPVM